MLQRPCLDCSVAMARPGQSRCFSCAKVKDHRRTAHRRTAPGDGAARRMRRAVNEAGKWRCSEDGQWHPAHQLEVDHRSPLVDGGHDVPANIQVLCHPHHAAKTAQEARDRRSGTR